MMKATTPKLKQMSSTQKGRKGWEWICDDFVELYFEVPPKVPIWLILSTQPIKESLELAVHPSANSGRTVHATTETGKLYPTWWKLGEFIEKHFPKVEKKTITLYLQIQYED